MKKALLLVSILSISVFSTACINNFAVQELNNKAKTYLEQGDYQNAIERLKSSIDLDDTVFETHYNLAVAYTQAEDYSDAIAAYRKAIELKPDFPDVYYSLAVAEESLAVTIESGDLTVNENNEITPAEKKNADDAEETKPAELSAAAKSMVSELLSDSIKNYEKYLELAQNPSDTEDVKNKIEALNDKLSPAPSTHDGAQ